MPDNVESGGSSRDPMSGDWKRLDVCPAASAQMIQWHAPETWAVIEETVRDRLLADARFAAKVTRS